MFSCFHVSCFTYGSDILISRPLFHSRGCDHPRSWSAVRPSSLQQTSDFIRPDLSIPTSRRNIVIDLIQ